MNETDFSFNIICVTETWCSDSELNNNSTFYLPNFKTIPLERKSKKRRGGVLIYLKNNLVYRMRDDLTVADGDKEILTIEILNQESKNILLSCCYRPPHGRS